MPLMPPSLWKELQLARLMPEQANLEALLLQVDGALAELSTGVAQMTDSARLQAAGELLWQVADLCAARADVLMTEWEETHRDPIVEPKFFADVVRQTMAVDLSDLIEPPLPRKRRTKPERKLAETIVASVDKVAVLALVDQLEAERTDEAVQQQVWAISHSEEVTQWIVALSQWLEAAPMGRVSFTHLCQSLELAGVEVWLALLCGGFKLEQEGEFYSDAVWVKRA